MTKSTSTIFAATLADLVKRCRRDLSDIEDAKTKLRNRLSAAAEEHGIDPAAVRRLLTWMRQSRDNGDIGRARQQELDAAYRAIMTGGMPVAAPRRVDSEMETVMSLATNNQPPKIDDIMRAVTCSRGKAHKLRTLAVARLAAKSSSSREPNEREHERSPAANDDVGLAAAE